MVLESGGQFTIHPNGTSMLPLIHPGRDSVSLAAVPEKLKNGDIVLYLRDSGEYVLHRIISISSGTYTMCGDNQLSLEQGISRSQIIAVAAGMVINGKSVTDRSLIYKLYCLLWKSFFIRRVYFKIRRLKNGS